MKLNDLKIVYMASVVRIKSVMVTMLMFWAGQVPRGLGFLQTVQVSSPEDHEETSTKDSD